MKSEAFLVFVFIFFKINYIQGLGLRKDYSSYSESAYTDAGSSKVGASESAYSSGKYSSEIASNSNHPGKSERSNFTSQVDSEDGEDEEIEIASTKSQDNKHNSENSDEDEYENNESSQVENSEHHSQHKESGKEEVNMPQVQYMARQQRFNLESTVNPPSDITNVNYVFLSPAAQKRIDRKISKLQRGGRYHGSTKETKTIGEWQKRYYSRPATEYSEVRTSVQGSSSIFTWVILAFIVTLVVIICLCGIRFVAKG